MKAVVKMQVEDWVIITGLQEKLVWSDGVF